MKNFYGSSHSGARKHVILFPGILFSHPLEEGNVSLPVLLNVYEIMNFNLTAVSTDSPTPQHKKRAEKKGFLKDGFIVQGRYWEDLVGLVCTGLCRSQLTGFPGQMTMMMSFCFLRYSFILCCVCP